MHLIHTMRHSRAPLAAALFAAAACASLTLAHPAHAWDANDPRVKHEAWSWNGTLAKGRTLEINGVNGAVIAEAGTGDKVEVTADKRGKKQDPAKVEIKVVQDSDGITICSVYPGQGSPCTNSSNWGLHWNDGSNDVEVEYHVKVPAGVEFHANTVNGAVRTHGLQGAVRAKTVNGAVDIEAAPNADVNAETVNGGVSASFLQFAPQHDLHFKTVNGAIRLALPANAGAEVHGSTVNGNMNTEFPLTIEGRWGPRSLRGTLGNGGPTLHVATVNGSIDLLRNSGKGAKSL